MEPGGLEYQTVGGFWNPSDNDARLQAAQRLCPQAHFPSLSSFTWRHYNKTSQLDIAKGTLVLLCGISKQYHTFL
jgi:hypothetical protein